MLICWTALSFLSFLWRLLRWRFLKKLSFWWRSWWIKSLHWATSCSKRRVKKLQWRLEFISLTNEISFIKKIWPIAHFQFLYILENQFIIKNRLKNILRIGILDKFKIFLKFTLLKNYETYKVFMNLTDQSLDRLQMNVELIWNHWLHEKFEGHQRHLCLLLSLKNRNIDLRLISFHNNWMNYSNDQESQLWQIILVNSRFCIDKQ